jgi:hypothetical protein
VPARPSDLSGQPPAARFRLTRYSPGGSIPADVAFPLNLPLARPSRWLYVPCGPLLPVVCDFQLPFRWVIAA